jgi:predicted amidohydrolase YtcJ
MASPGRDEGPAVKRLLRGGVVWTGLPGSPRAEALLVRGERIAWVGSDREAERFTDDVDEVIDLAGRLLIPGVVDAHNHVRLGSTRQGVQLAGAKSLEEIRRRIEAFRAAHPGLSWIHGEGFDYAALPGGRHPTAEDLAGVGGGLPIMLLDYSVHAAWLNRAALDAFGITASTREVPFGIVEHDPDRGEPTGYLNHFATMGLSRAGLAALRAVSPAYSLEAQYARLTSGLAMAARYGITTIVEPQNSLDDLALFARARAEGMMRSRVVAALFHPVGTTVEEIDAFEEARRRYDDDRFRVGPIKLYIDDIVEPHTAAMFEPYANRPDTRGSTYYDPDEFAEVVTALDARGLQCFVHATGDRGIHTVLDAMGAARRRNGVRDARHQVVHVECVRECDLGRFAELGVVACMQPRHCAPEIVEQWRENVGARRWRYAWPMRSLAERGAVLAFSSDWNVAEMDPMVGLYTASTRASLDGARSWVPEETVDLETALRAYTWGGAYSVFAEHDRGTLEAGKYADLAVLSRDLLEAAPRDVLDTRVELTLVAGEVVHRTP